MDTVALSQRLRNFCLPGPGWATRHHACRRRFRKSSVSWPSLFYQDYRIPDEKEIPETAAPNTGSGSNEEDMPMVVKKPKRKHSKRVRPAAPRVSVKKQRVPIALRNDEIVRDFVAITGKRPVRKPQKRKKVVQKVLDYLFPGSDLGPIIMSLDKDSKTTAMV